MTTFKLVVSPYFLQLEPNNSRHTKFSPGHYLLSSNSTPISQTDPFRRLPCGNILDCKNMHTPGVQRTRAANKAVRKKATKHTHACQLASQLKPYVQAILHFL